MANQAHPTNGLSRNRFYMENVDPNDDWSCAIKCDQCTFVKANGNQCLNTVCFGSPYCWIHNRMAYGVRARPSTIPGAGKGLFATRPFAVDDWICPMICESLTQACFDTRYPGNVTAPYAEQDIFNAPFNIVDCACERGIGSFANARFNANGTVRPLNDHNALTEHRNEIGFFVGIWLRANQPIQPGSEIFLWYGDNYILENNHTTRRRKGNDGRPC